MKFHLWNLAQRAKKLCRFRVKQFRPINRLHSIYVQIGILVKIFVCIFRLVRYDSVELHLVHGKLFMNMVSCCKVPPCNALLHFLSLMTFITFMTFPLFILCDSVSILWKN